MFICYSVGPRLGGRLGFGISGGRLNFDDFLMAMMWNLLVNFDELHGGL
jgi:hypothetical protein